VTEGDGEAAAALDLVDYYTPLLLRLCIDAGVIAAFGRDERSPSDVAAATGTHVGTLERVVRALESRGVFERGASARFRLTDIGRRFLPDEPGNLSGFASFRSWELHAWAEATFTLQTGRPAFPHHFGRQYWNWLADHPAVASKFNAGMRQRTAALLDVALPRFEWPARGTVVDVGGGNGQLLARVLVGRSALRGIVFDLPQGVTEALPLLEAAGVANRVDVVAGNFFEAIPTGHDLYILASVLHDWDDTQAACILECCRRAMPPSGRLLLFESVLATGAEADLGKLVDLHMLVLFGGRERSREQWQALLAGAGFAIHRIVPTPALHWIEARPVG
jgi:SAM-dependent methyltransferase